VVLGLKEEALFRVLVIGLSPYRIREPATHRRPGGLDGKRCTLRDFFSELHRFLTHAPRLGQQIGKPPRKGFFASDAAPGVKHQACLLNSDYPGQGVCEPKTRMNAELHEVRAKASVWRHNSKVCNERKPKPSADRRTLNRGHDWLRTSKESYGVLIETARRTGNFIFGLCRRRVEVSAGAKGLPFRSEHDSSAVVFSIHRLEGVGEILYELGIEIIMRRPVNFYERDVAVVPNGYVAVVMVRHFVSLAGYRRATRPERRSSIANDKWKMENRK
jgi:hypothetical protein